ncbi:hypothetical protein EV426DRAFT_578984 [Tirmania nivea]|nr:hypothetical protein EV426DRAFT_578984 [Tirmania nivea]
MYYNLEQKPEDHTETRTTMKTMNEKLMMAISPILTLAETKYARMRIRRMGSAMMPRGKCREQQDGRESNEGVEAWSTAADTAQVWNTAAECSRRWSAAAEPTSSYGTSRAVTECSGHSGGVVEVWDNPAEWLSTAAECRGNVERIRGRRRRYMAQLRSTAQVWSTAAGPTSSYGASRAVAACSGAVAERSGHSGVVVEVWNNLAEGSSTATECRGMWSASAEDGAGIGHSCGVQRRYGAQQRSRRAVTKRVAQSQHAAEQLQNADGPAE